MKHLLTESDLQILEAADKIFETKVAPYQPEGFTTPSRVASFLRNKLAAKEREEFLVMYLDSQHRLIGTETLFTGTIDSASVYPREVLKGTLRANAAAVILAHNHPSGHPEPSNADQRITERLKTALSYVDIPLLDHFVIGGSEYVSFAERGLL